MIFSIGHGNKAITRFLNELETFHIDYLVDVRSKPYSKYHPQFDRESLKVSLLNSEIKYLYLGDDLGGLPNDSSCYVDGKVNYDALKKTEYFKAGINRLLTAHEKHLNVAIMCSESKPEECHRSKAIGDALSVKSVSVEHIISSDMTKDQVTVMNELTAGKSGVDLFGNMPTFSSRKKYR
jgi:uncharacterized protein (DUF488 family)